jgi:hypothetical protein
MQLGGPSEPPVTASRRGLRLRYVDGGKRSYFEVAKPGELERLKPQLTLAEYEAGVRLRQLWASGTMIAEPSASCLNRLGLPPRGYHSGPDDDRLAAQDALRTACRVMGMMGMGGQLAIDVCIYERRIETVAGLAELREALGRLAQHLGGRPRRAVGIT